MTNSCNREEIYLEYGRAAEMAQSLELAAGNFLLAFVTGWWDLSKISDEQREAVRSWAEDVDSRTFGRLLKMIRSIEGVDDTALSILQNALDKRNYLVHKFFRRHNFAIYSDAGRTRMKEDLREIQKSLSLAISLLNGMTSSFLRLMGHREMPLELLDRLMAAGKTIPL